MVLKAKSSIRNEAPWFRRYAEAKYNTVGWRTKGHTCHVLLPIRFTPCLHCLTDFSSACFLVQRDYLSHAHTHIQVTYTLKLAIVAIVRRYCHSAIVYLCVDRLPNLSAPISPKSSQNRVIWVSSLFHQNIHDQGLKRGPHFRLFCRDPGTVTAHCPKCCGMWILGPSYVPSFLLQGLLTPQKAACHHSSEGVTQRSKCMTMYCRSGLEVNSKNGQKSKKNERNMKNMS